MPVTLAERTEDICEEKFKGTATTSLRAGETHSDEITDCDQKKKNLCAPKPKETADILTPGTNIYFVTEKQTSFQTLLN